MFELQEGGIEIAKSDDTLFNDYIRATRVRLIGVWPGFLFELQEGGIEIAKSDDTLFNDYIRATRVRLIGVDGSQLGLFDTRDAQRIADDQNLDLVEIAPNAEPPVCKVMVFCSSCKKEVLR